MKGLEGRTTTRTDLIFAHSLRLMLDEAGFVFGFVV